MQSSTNTTTHHPLHLLDDLLTSITTTSSNCKHTQNTNDIDGTKDTNNNENVEDDNTISLAAEAKQDLVLRAANELFGNNMSLLENALALLDEQEQYQRDHGNKNNKMDIDDNTTQPLPVIRRIRAKRSGRTAVLVRKTRKKSSYKSKSNNTSPSHQVHTNTNEEKKPSVSTTDEYYLCLMGREKIDRRTVMSNNNDGTTSSSGVWCKVQRQGAHCTCRSFSQNIKGGNSRSSSSSSPKRNNDSSTQSVMNSNAVVCKHLLAAILLPHMLPWSKSGCELEDEIVDDREFAKLISKASIG